jgi:hypothetical protein
MTDMYMFSALKIPWQLATERLYLELKNIAETFLQYFLK